MLTDELPKELKLPVKADHEERKYIKCTKCGSPAFYDFQPYSIKNPALFLRCGHGDPRNNSIEIPEEEFCKLVVKTAVNEQALQEKEL